MARTFAGVLFALLLLLTAIFALHYYADYRAERARREASELLNVELARRALVSDIAAVATDTMFLARHMESLSFDPVAAGARRSYLAELFITFAQEKGFYDQIRFLDEGGRELVRVNYGDGDAVLVDAPGLQDKSARYYVNQAQGLGEGQIYLSPLDLNVEDGDIQRPLQPVLRFATPVFDIRGKRRGLVVLNYLGRRLLDDFVRAADQAADRIQLVNGAGYWLHSSHPDLNWGFMFGRDETFARRFPGPWFVILDNDAGQFSSDAGLFSYATVWPGAEAAKSLRPGAVAPQRGEVWKVISHLPLNSAIAGSGDFLRRHGPLYIGLSLMMSLLAFLLASAQVHRRAAEAQRGYEQRFRRTLEEIGLVALMVDTEGRLTFCNRFLLELTGWQRDEVVGSDWVERFVPNEQRPQVREVLQRLGRSGELPSEFEGHVLTRDGERHLIAWNNALLRDTQGRVTGLTAIGEDITERRYAEQQVRKLSLAVEQSPAMVVITDFDGAIEYVNPKFTSVTGYQFDEVQGRNPRILKSGDTRIEDYQSLWRSVTTGGEWRGIFHNRRKNGSLYWEAAVITGLRDVDGTITHLLAVKEDITERKRLEAEVQTRQKELARAQTLAEMGRMASMLAHDLRNPLSSVKMAVQVLAKRAQQAEEVELAQIGQEQVRYMEDIITDMLTYSRPSELVSSWLVADKLLDGVIGIVRRRVQEYQVDVRVECEPGLPSFPGDANKLRQLLSNLLVNAFQAVAVRPAGERIVRVSVDMDLGEAGTLIRFAICDNGGGIDASVREHLFEPFFTTRTKGTGLGLAIVKQITELHHGSIRLEANQPKGSCAVLMLPVVPVMDDAGSKGVNESGAGLT